MVFGFIPECRSDSFRNQRSASPESSQYADNTGFNHNGFRNYNPTMGRYLESDPVGLGGGLNTYACAGSSPMTLVDPEGLREHSYAVTDPICSLSDSCTPQSVFQELQDNPAPFIAHRVNSGDPNYIPGLGHIVTCVNESNGRLVRVDRKARMGRNPATGATIKIAAKKTVKFRITKSAKDAIIPLKVKKWISPSKRVPLAQ